MRRVVVKFADGGILAFENAQFEAKDQCVVISQEHLEGEPPLYPMTPMHAYPWRTVESVDWELS